MPRRMAALRRYSRCPNIRPVSQSEPRPSQLPQPRTSRGWRTRRRILAAAEQVFGRDGFYRASVVDITRAAGIAQGTFYLYFPSKEALFVELVRTMGHDMRRHLHDAARDIVGRAQAEEAGFRAFFAFVARHPDLYRIVRECQFVDPREYRDWYERLAQPYVAALRRAAAEGEVADEDVDLEIAAYCLIGMGDFLGMRMVLWEGRRRVPPRVLRTLMRIVRSGLLTGPPPPPAT
jgi:AcrR family transcriptional regulator